MSECPKAHCVRISNTDQNLKCAFMYIVVKDPMGLEKIRPWIFPLSFYYEFLLTRRAYSVKSANAAPWSNLEDTITCKEASFPADMYSFSGLLSRNLEHSTLHGFPKPFPLRSLTNGRNTKLLDNQKNTSWTISIHKISNRWLKSKWPSYRSDHFCQLHCSTSSLSLSLSHFCIFCKCKGARLCALRWVWMYVCVCVYTWSIYLSIYLLDGNYGSLFV